MLLLKAQDAPLGSGSHISDGISDFELVLQKTEEIGAMTDGSKRREVDDPGPSHKRPVPAYDHGNVFPVPMAPQTSSMAFTALESMTKNPLPSLPAGVLSMDEWGRSVIQFGKFKHDYMSYEELRISQQPRMKDYVKWCRARSKTADGQLKDLISYFEAVDCLARKEPESSGPFVPGTDCRRMLKWLYLMPNTGLDF